MNDLHWMSRGLCQGCDPDKFFPDRGASTKEARATCGCCPVRLDCLAWALTQNELFGIWGGTSVRERRRLRGLEVVA